MDNTPAKPYFERQAFAGWVYVIMAASTLAVLLAVSLDPKTSGLDMGMLVPLAIMGLAANILAMKTEVDEEKVVVTFGALFPLYRRTLRRSEIVSAHAESYSPLGEFGGWGIRGWGKNTALNARGDRGVRLTLSDGRRILIGSQRPEELQQAVTTG